MLRATLLVTLLPVMASAKMFGDTPGCAWLAGEAPTTDSLYLYDQETIQRLESTCPMTGALHVGSGGTVVTVERTGEGETWAAYYMIMTTADENTLLFHPEAHPEAVTEIKVCEIK
jgi:hypothetical protein